MINKFQQGGAAGGGILQQLAQLPKDQQQKIMTAFGKWAQAKGLNIQQLQGNEQALEAAMGQFLQEMQGQQGTVSARLGAKLNYVRSLKGDCPEGQEVVYFKEGGRVCKKCIAKNVEGGKPTPKGKDAVKDFRKKREEPFEPKTTRPKPTPGTNRKRSGVKIDMQEDGGKAKKGCGGFALKHQKGGKQDQATKDSIQVNKYGSEEIESTRPGKYIKDKNGKVVWAPDRTKAPYKKENKPKKHLLGGLLGF